MKTISFDATILTSLQGCPRYMKNRYIDLNVKEDKSNSLESGQLAHVILEYTNKSLIAGLSRIDAIEKGYEAGNLMLKGCAVCISNNPCELHKNDWKGLKNIPLENTKSDIGSKWIFDTIAQYHDYYRADDFVHLAAEETRGKIIYRDDDIQILWKAKFDDIIDSPEGIMSRDYKTMKQRRDTLSLNNQFMGQCITLGARQVLIDKIGFQTSLKPHEKFTRVRLPYSIDRLLEFAQEIVPFYARMLLAYTEADHFPPNFTHCETKYGFCDYVHICELDRNLREEAMKINFVKGKVWDI